MQGILQQRDRVMPKVLIIIGSASDLEKMEPCGAVLKQLGISFARTVSSAHRTPERTVQIVKKAEENGCQVFICAAGMAAHLAGAVAARTIRPVIGVPLSGSALCGMDSLFSTVQMPSGYPVATVALDKAGAANAAWLAASILALSDEVLALRLTEARKQMAEKVRESAAKIEEE